MTNEEKLESKFHEAVENKDSKFRQDFLNSINLDGTLISRLIYREDIDFYGISLPANDRIAEMQRVNPFRQFSPIKKGKILVYPLAFSYEFHECYGDLLSTLIDHEEFHIRQHNKHSFMLWINAMRDLVSSNSKKVVEYAGTNYSTELAAYENQLKNGNIRNISPIFRAEIERRVESTLKRYKPLNEITNKKLFYELIPI